MEIVLAIVAALFVVGVVSTLAVIGTAGQLLYICEPNEVLVVSGGGSGKKGYLTVKGGRIVSDTRGKR